jgi:hypothetical protein
LGNFCSILSASPSNSKAPVFKVEQEAISVVYLSRAEVPDFICGAQGFKMGSGRWQAAILMHEYPSRSPIRMSVSKKVPLRLSACGGALRGKVCRRPTNGPLELERRRVVGPFLAPVEFCNNSCTDPCTSQARRQPFLASAARIRQ